MVESGEIKNRKKKLTDIGFDRWLS